ncbi:hypothetical protein JMJ56_07540 [Belnapia sp. T18]|uniref:Uncharacterized protein n=1 Tax=Belnapia arida TaxID=2804533 RepID=A0ABS1TZK1_9PROT|nr:hypothetical protein [Belnapia arida]MBL6077852.1 hypothetical protein [Belnapia arida]
MSHSTAITDIDLPLPIALAPPLGDPIDRRLRQAWVDAGVTLTQMGRALGVSTQRIHE